jgi:hypothetical protein
VQEIGSITRFKIQDQRLVSEIELRDNLVSCLRSHGIKRALVVRPRSEKRKEHEVGTDKKNDCRENKFMFHQLHRNGRMDTVIKHTFEYELRGVVELSGAVLALAVIRTIIHIPYFGRRFVHTAAAPGTFDYNHSQSPIFSRSSTSTIEYPMSGDAERPDRAPLEVNGIINFHLRCFGFDF